MEKIDIYDKFIHNRLSSKEREEFIARLENDKEFETDFNLYLFTVNGICREVYEDNLDFGLALKRFSKEQLKDLIG